MGLVKGSPVALVTLFFGAAVVSMGGLYALLPAITSHPTLVQMGVFAALGMSLVFSMLVVARVFWVVAQSTRKTKIAKPTQKR